MRQHLDLSKNQVPVPRHLQKPAELSRLAVLAQQGDERAKEDLYWRMRPLVYRLALKYGHGSDGDGHGRYSEEQRREILQEAWAGLADAVQRWDPDHPGGLRLWTVASYRITIAIKHWQAQNSGSLSMTRHAWESAWRIQGKLDALGIVEWETLTDEALKAHTGEASAGPILRARQTKGGHLEELEAAEVDPVGHSSPSAEDEYMGRAETDAHQELAAYLLRMGAWRLTEEDVYWKLEALGLAGELEAADVLRALEEQQT